MPFGFPSGFSNILLDWFENNKEIYPWRSDQPNPYHVWLSEVMLQQTTAKAVVPYFLKFLEKFPTLEALARSQEEDILTLWQGLGYYSRARNLHKASKLLNENFPTTKEGLLKIPGIGDYTASSILSIAFEKRAVVVDGNVKRVIARCFGLEKEADILSHADQLTPQEDVGNYAQGIMDFWRFVCTPKNPKCDICPLNKGCYAALHGMQDQLPVKVPKPPKSLQFAVAFVIVDLNAQAVYMEKETTKKLLHGLFNAPTTPWVENQEWEAVDALQHAPISGNFEFLEDSIKHIFTHIDLRVKVCKISINKPFKGQGEFIPFKDLSDYPLSTLARKILKFSQ